MAEMRTFSIPVIDQGLAIGIVQWMNVDLAEGIEFSNHPDSYCDGGWLQVFHSFSKPLSVSAGESLDLVVGYDRTSLIVALGPMVAR